MLLFMTAAAPPTDGAMLDNCIKDIAGGDREALAALYTQTRAAVYGFALSMVKNPADAEDVLQDTYLQAWQAAGGYRARGKAMAWPLTIARNLSLDRLRQQGRVSSLDAEEALDHLAERPAVTAEDRMLLGALLTALEDQERQIVTLHALAGLKHREIAGLLALPISTVLSKYNRALKKLRLAWKEAE